MLSPNIVELCNFLFHLCSLRPPSSIFLFYYSTISLCSALSVYSLHLLPPVPQWKPIILLSPLCSHAHAHNISYSPTLSPHVLLSSSSPASSAGRLTAVCIHSCTCVTHWSATGRWAWGGGGHLRIVFPLSYCNLCYKARGVA